MTHDWLVDPLVWWFHFPQMILSAAHISSGRWCFPPAGCILPETEARCSHMQRMERDLDPYTSPTIKLLVPKDQQIICSYLFSLLPSMNWPQTRRWLLCYSAWTSYDGRSWTTPQSGSWGIAAIPWLWFILIQPDGCEEKWFNQSYHKISKEGLCQVHLVISSKLKNGTQQ